MDKLHDLLWEVVWPRFLARGALRAVKRHLHNQELPCTSRQPMHSHMLVYKILVCTSYDFGCIVVIWLFHAS